MARKKKSNIAFTRDANNYDVSAVDTITVGEDTLRLRLKDFEEGNFYKNVFVFGFGILVTTIVTLLTTNDFKPIFDIPSNVWNGIFYVAFVISILLVIGSAIMWAWRRKTIDDIIKQLKGE